MIAETHLLTVADHVQLLVNALADSNDHHPVIKLFTPDGAATWLISEVDPDDPDRLFGLCDLGLGFPELVYVSLKEITALRGPLGLPVERDEHFLSYKPFTVYAHEAPARGRVVTCSEEPRSYTSPLTFHAHDPLTTWCASPLTRSPRT